jgi:hypothetical protein
MRRKFAAASLRLVVLGTATVMVAAAPGCRAPRGAQLQPAKQTGGETMPLPQWLTQRLIRDRFSFVLFKYDDIAVSDLTNGQRKAFGSTRTWQEQLYIPALRAPDLAVQRVHPHSPSGEPDAVSLEYAAGGYAVQAFRVMNRMAMLFTPDDDMKQMLGLPGAPIDLVANQIARTLIVYPGQVLLEVETQEPDGAYGSQKPDPAKDAEARGPLDFLRWWYADGTFGFATWLVTPVLDGHYPSTAFVSDQQVYLWFETLVGSRTRTPK